MAMTVNPVAVVNHVPGDLRESIIKLTFGAADTYVTGGFAVTPATFGFSQAISFVEPAVSNTGGYVFQYNPATGKILAFSAAGTQLANASAALQNDIVYIQALGQ